LRIKLLFFTALVSVSFLLQENIPIFWIYAALGIYFFFQLPRFPSRINLTMGFALGFCTLCLGYLVSPYDFTSVLREGLRYVFLLLIFLELRDPANEDLLDKILRIIIFLAVLMGFGGVYQVFFALDPMPLSWAATPGVEPWLKRAFGLFDNPNLFGTFLFLSAFASSFLWLEREEKLMAPTAFFLWGVLILTQSRGAILAAVITLVFFALVCAKRYRGTLWILAAVLCLGFFLSGRGKSLVSQDLGVNQRWELLKGSISFFKAHWKTGISPGSFYLVYPQYRTVGGYYPLHAHNHFLEILVETGVLGGFLFLGFCCGLLRYFYQTRGSPWALAMFLGILINSMTNQSFSFFPISLLALCALLVMSTPSPLEWKHPSKLWFLLFYLLAALLFAEFHKSAILADFLGPLGKPGDYPFYVRRDLFTVTRLVFRVISRNGENGSEKEPVSEEDFRLCEKWLRPLLRTYPHEGEVPYLLYSLYAQRGNWKLAVAMLHLARQRDPLSEKYAVSLMDYHLLKGQAEDARILGEQAVVSNPGYRRINPWYDQLQIRLFKAYQILEEYEVLREKLEEGIWVDEELGKRVYERWKKNLIP